MAELILAFIGNIIYFVLGGFWTGCSWLLATLFAAVSIIGWPMVPGLLRITRLAFWPFGYQLVPARETGPSNAGLGFITTIFNIIWAILIGIPLFIVHVVSAVAQAITIIGIPFALVTLKLGIAAFAPAGKRVVPAGLLSL